MVLTKDEIIFLGPFEYLCGGGGEEEGAGSEEEQ